MAAAENLIGKKFNKLTVHKRVQVKSMYPLWFCICECGDYAVVSSNNLVQNHTKSCGCIKLEKMKTRFKTHGLRNHKLYRIWSGIIQRCDKKYCINYRDYGGRGISVCNEWYDFKTFYDWAISNGWILGLQIDRVDVNGNYEPNNCRWVTAKDNARNKRNSKITVQIAKDIRESKESTNVLMKKYNVCKTTINNIKTNISWN